MLCQANSKAYGIIAYNLLYRLHFAFSWEFVLPAPHQVHVLCAIRHDNTQGHGTLGVSHLLYLFIFLPSNCTCSMPAISGSFTSTPASFSTSLSSTPVHSQLLMAPQLHPKPLTGLTLVMSSRRLPAHWIAVTTLT